MYDQRKTAWKGSKYGVFPGPFQSEYKKIRNRKNSVSGHLSCSEMTTFKIIKNYSLEPETSMEKNGLFIKQHLLIQY